MKGWTVAGSSAKRSAYPIFGAMRLGQSGSNGNIASLTTPAFNSDKLSEDIGIKTTVKVKVAYCATNLDESALAYKSTIAHYRGENLVKTEDFDVRELYPTEWAANNGGDTATDYAHYQQYYELTFETYLRKGDVLTFTRPYDKGCKGMQVIGDVLVEVTPNNYEGNITNPDDTGIGTEPDDTDYDVFNMGEFPISYWWNIPTAFHNYDEAKTRELYKDMADAGINVVNYNGEVDGSLEENIRIMNLCTELGMKFIGGLYQYGDYADQRIADIKQYLAPSDTYVGEYLADEPGASRFDELGDFTKRYLQEIPNKEVYINLFPMYASPTQLGTDTYEEHIDQYLEKIPTKSVSYDYYGLNANGTATSYYTNLDLVRSKTLAVKKPFWVITQTGKVSSNRMPTEKEERWSVWSTIAGGSKGISYFCYWNPSDDGNTAMVNRDGQKTEMYDWIKQINADINTIGKKLLPCHADGLIASTTLYHQLFDNSGAGRTKYGPVQHVSAVSNHVAVGCFRDARISENGDNYKGYKVLVTPHQPNKAIQTRLTLDTSVTTITVTQNNTSKVVELNNLTDVKVIDGDNGVVLTYADGKLTLNIPQGEALLIEF